MVLMRKWNPEYRTTQEERNLMVGGIVMELAKEGAEYALYVGGDTLVVGAVDPDGNICIYDCAIRRSNLDDDAPDGTVATLVSPAQLTVKPS